MSFDENLGDCPRIKALVAVSSATIAFDKLFSYAVPYALTDKAVPGVRVIVPFGKGNRKRTGLILETAPWETGEENSLKEIISVADSEPVLNAEMMELIGWLKDNTFCTYYDAVKTMIPSGMNINIREHYSLTGKTVETELSEKERKVLEYMKKSSDTDVLAEEVKAAGNGLVLESLIAKGFIEYRLSGKQNTGDSSVRMLTLTDEYKAEPKKFRLTAKQKKQVWNTCSR